MTAMNWESLNLKLHPREYSHDQLPDTGSWKDQSRYFNGNQKHNIIDSRAKKYQLKENVEVNNRLHAIKLVVNYMNTPHYKTRANIEKTQILDALRVSLKKLLSANMPQEFFRQAPIIFARRECKI